MMVVGYSTCIDTSLKVKAWTGSNLIFEIEIGETQVLAGLKCIKSSLTLQLDMSVMVHFIIDN